MSKHKKQHYLPNFYLKGFSNGPLIINGIQTNEYNVWVFNKSKNEFIFKSTKNVAYEPYYYSYKDTNGSLIHDIEFEFSQLETLSKKVFNKIEQSVKHIIQNPTINTISFDDNDIHDICLFIANMMKRNPKTIDNMTKELTEFYDKQSIKYNHLYNKDEIKRGVLKTMKDLGTSEEYNFVDKLYNKNFYFLYITNPNISFITSDFPIVTFRKNGPSGIAYADTEIYVPINKSILLTLYSEGRDTYFRKFNDCKKVSLLNRHLAGASKNLIIGKDKELLERLSRYINKP